jgi:hypothetical protein
MIQFKRRDRPPTSLDIPTLVAAVVAVVVAHLARSRSQSL